jgi:hypothetical protein
MGHNRKYGNQAPALVITPGFVRHLDKDSSQSINGDEGGVWTPDKPIVIGGAGVLIEDAGGFAGGVTTGTSRGATGGALVLGDDDWPEHAARTRTVLFPVVDRLGARLDYTDWVTSVEPGALKLGAVSGISLVIDIDGRRLPAGATIASVTLRFSVGDKPTAVPGSLPTLQLKTGALTDSATLPTPATVDDYFADGRPQSLVVVPVNIPTVVAGEPLQVWYLDSSMTRNVLHSLAFELSGITDMRPGL